MPTYDYECQHCAHQLEKYQSFAEKALVKCPKCKRNSLQRKIGCPFFIIKGEAKTLQQQAERNSKKFGKAECEERELRAEERVAKATGKKKKKNIPWWRNGAVEGLDIVSDKPLTPEQTAIYSQQLNELGCTAKDENAPPKRIKHGKKK